MFAKLWCINFVQFFSGTPHRTINENQVLCIANGWHNVIEIRCTRTRSIFIEKLEYNMYNLNKNTFCAIPSGGITFKLTYPQIMYTF